MVLVGFGKLQQVSIHIWRLFQRNTCNGLRCIIVVVVVVVVCGEDKGMVRSGIGPFVCENERAPISLGISKKIGAIIAHRDSVACLRR